MALVTSRPIDIPTGEDGISDVFHIGNYKIVGFIIPEGWVEAPLTFKGGTTEANVQDLYDEDGEEISIDAFTESRAILLLEKDIPRGATWLAIRSGTADDPIDQTGSPTIVLMLEDRS